MKIHGFLNCGKAVQKGGRIRIEGERQGSSNVAPRQSDVLQLLVRPMLELRYLAAVIENAPRTDNRLPEESEDGVICKMCHGKVLLLAVGGISNGLFRASFGTPYLWNIL
jgi:hypothetical protein